MVKLAILVGCCYPNTRDAVRGCYNDVSAMNDLLTRTYRFQSNHVIMLTDAAGTSAHLQPTGYNIKQQLYEKILLLNAGDVLVFYFNGHGTHHDFWYSGSQYCKREEAIVPTDRNLIYSVDFRDMANRVPQGAQFVVIADSCNSGGLIDNTREQVGPGFPPDVCYASPERHENYSERARFMPIGSIQQYLRSLSGTNSSDIRTLLQRQYRDNASLIFQVGNVDHRSVPIPLTGDGGILISSCQSNQLAEENIDPNSGRPYGLFTIALYYFLRYRSPGPISYRSLVQTIRTNLRTQQACLYCSDMYVDAPFLGQ